MQSVDGFLIRLTTGDALLREWDPIELSAAHAVARVAILAYGSTVQIAIQAARELAEEDGTIVALVNARWAKPLDEELILRLARATRAVVTIEDGVVAGGFGGAVSELLHAQTDDVATTRLKRMGLPDRFVEHGPVAVLRQGCGLSADGLKSAVRELLERDGLARRNAAFGIPDAAIDDRHQRLPLAIDRGS